MTQTQPDIGFLIQWLFKFLQKPFQTYLNTGKNLLKFLNSTEKLAICYGRKGLTNGLQPIKYYDNDFVGDKESSKSIYSYMFKFAGGPINWKSKRAFTVVLSTLEVETDVLTKDIREISWIIGLFKELERPISRLIILHNDNQNAITTAYNPTFHSRTKYTLLKYYYVREQVKQWLIKVIYLDTKRISADGLIKPLNNHLYSKFFELLDLELKPVELGI